MFIGQLVFHFLLKHQSQDRMRIGTGRVEIEGFFQRHLGPFASALLQIADTQLDIGITRLITSLAGSHRVDIASRHTAGQQADN
ncbi:hypothetical protein D3C86_1742650 [compost metagenome]